MATVARNLNRTERDRSDVRRRHKIIDNFASWTAVSAARRSKLRKEEEISPALQKVAFREVLCGDRPIDGREFDEWHREQVQRFREEAERSGGRGCAVGWAAKIINVYLKTQCYVGGRGRKGLDEVIHPPIDRILIGTLKKKYPKKRVLRDFSLSSIVDYSCYQQIVELLVSIAKQERCKLIEVEQHWNYLEQ